MQHNMPNERKDLGQCQFSSVEAVDTQTLHDLGALFPQCFPYIIFNFMFQDKIVSMTLSLIGLFLPKEVLTMPTAAN